ncbi:hypothetical protein EDB85DRAFT_2206628 [Lactarius pseudohatsudake]|nr:hypothetical protein EDB85DRAFT_2206628 [Lactarius pseudohatsudake]
MGEGESGVAFEPLAYPREEDSHAYSVTTKEELLDWVKNGDQTYRDLLVPVCVLASSPSSAFRYKSYADFSFIILDFCIAAVSAWPQNLSKPVPNPSRIDTSRKERNIRSSSSIAPIFTAYNQGVVLSPVFGQVWLQGAEGTMKPFWVRGCQDIASSLSPTSRSGGWGADAPPGAWRQTVCDMWAIGPSAGLIHAVSHRSPKIAVCTADQGPVRIKREVAVSNLRKFSSGGYRYPDRYTIQIHLEYYQSYDLLGELARSTTVGPGRHPEGSELAAQSGSIVILFWNSTRLESRLYELNAHRHCYLPVGDPSHERTASALFGRIEHKARSANLWGLTCGLDTRLSGHSCMAFRRCIAPPRFLAFVRAKIVRDKEMNATPTWYGIRGIKTGHDTIGPTTCGAMSKFADAAHRPIQSIRKWR